MNPPSRTGCPPFRRALGVAGLTLVICLTLTLIACRALWTSHLEEADRQLKAAAPLLCRKPPPVASVAFWLSGQAAPWQLVALVDESTGERLADDSSWLAADRAALGQGGVFKTRWRQGVPWRLIGWRQQGWSVRLAVQLQEVQAEILEMALRMTMAGTVFSAGLALLAFRRGRASHLQLRNLIRSLETPDPDAAQLQPDAADPPETVEMKQSLLAHAVRHQRSLEVSQRFGADASHELRTPLAIIQASVESALLQPDPGPRMPEFLESLLVPCRRLRVTLDALQLLAKADAGCLAPSLNPVEPRKLVEALLEDLSGEIQERGMRLETALASLTVQAEEGLLRLAVWNLLNNAVRHNLTCGGFLTVRLDRVAHTPWLRLIVTNSAPPLAADERETIFERFQRGRSARNSGVPGQGLGLSLTRAAVLAHGGELKLVRSDAQGTEFELLLPVDEK